MERFLLLWDEVDEYVGLGRIFVTGAVQDVASATHSAASQLKGWTCSAAGWVARQNEGS